MAKSGSEIRATDGVYDLKNDKVNAVGIGLNSRTLLIIKLPDSRALRIISRSMLLAILLLTLPSFASIIGGGVSFDHGSMYSWPDSRLGFPDGPRILPIILRDLVDEGVVRKGLRGFVLAHGLKAMEGDLEFLRDAGIDLLTGPNLEREKAGLNRTFDFVFLSKFDIQIVDRITKDGGLVVSLLGPHPSDELKLPGDFRIVYLRRFKSTVVAVKKIASNKFPNAISKKVSCRFTSEKKEEALKGLENVYLEPPRRAETKSGFTSRKIKALPNLIKGSLNEYPRKVFVSDDSRALDWFYKNYPMRDQEFEVYRLGPRIGNERGGSDGEWGREVGPDWLRRNVGPDDYVVMKAEAGLVEEMMRDRSLCLVDELFMECKNEGEGGAGGRKSERDYWQCLDLYGRVSDEGITVHQWWY